LLFDLFFIKEQKINGINSKPTARAGGQQQQQQQQQQQ
jgi:hypothetical protein